MNTATPDQTPRWRFVAPLLLGGVIFAVIDGAIGLRLQGSPVHGGSQLLAYFVQIIGQLMAVALPVALALTVADLALRRWQWRASGTVWLIAIAAACAFEWLNLELFQGGGIREKAYRPALEWAFRIVAAPAVIAGVILVARVASRRWMAAAGLVVGAGLLVANAIKYRFQYLDIHLQLAPAALACCALAVHALANGRRFDPAGSWKRTAGLVALAIVALLLSVHGGRVPVISRSWAHVTLEVAKRPYGLAQFSYLVTPVLRLAGQEGPKVADAVDVTALLQRLAPQLDPGQALTVADRGKIQQELDQRLPGRRKLNILWLAIDTLRADHCHFLGYPRATTSTLDKLAEDAFVFEQARTPYPTSNFAFSATLTSLAARISLVYGLKYDRHYPYHPLHSFPALMKSVGHFPAAVTAFDRDKLESADAYKWFKNLKDGFDVFNPDQTEAAADGPYVADSTIKVLRGHLGDKRKPFFLWSHLMDPHAPYVRHPEFDFGGNNLDEYDSEIAFADHAAGRLIEELAAQDRLRDTIIVAFADHGEEFNEHGGTTHSTQVYDEQIHVPLLIRIPGIKGRRITSVVSLLDLVPTMTDLLAVKDPVRRQGRSLLPLMFGNEDPDGGIAYSEVFGLRSEEHVKDRRSVVLGRKKLIHRVQEGIFEFYDLARDPREQESLIGRGLPEEGVLRGLLQAWDASIDGHFGTAAMPESRPLADQIVQEIDRLTAPDQKVARAAADDLYKHLFNSYAELQPKTLAVMSKEQMDAYFDRIADVYPRLKGTIRLSALTMLCRREHPRFIPLFKEQIAQGGEPTLLACVALAALGDAAGEAGLEAAAQSPAVPNKSDVAWSMVRLGSPKAPLDWFYMDLMSVKFGRPLRETILTLPKLKTLVEPLHDDRLPAPSRIIRERVFEEVYRHPEVNRAIVDAMRGEKSEDAMLILLRLARNEEEDIRARARAALTLVMSPEDLTRNLEAQDDEMAADEKLLNGQFAAAVEKFEVALKKGTLVNIGLRFRMARALHFAGVGPDAAKTLARAREVLDEIGRIAPIAMDRQLAKRRIAQLAWPRDVNTHELKATVLDVKVPEYIRPGDWFTLHARLRNDGPEPWYGGWASGSVELAVRFLLEDGTLHETQREKNITNRFLESGVLPGEEVSVDLLGVGLPREVKPQSGTLTVMFRNNRGGKNYPDRGIVLRQAWSAAAASRPAPTDSRGKPK